MDVDVAEVNGGNAEVAHDDSNLESTEAPDSQIIETADNENSAEELKMEVDEVNGDVKAGTKQIELPVKRKLRKSKSNSTSSVETDAKPKTRGQKRQLSEADDTSSQDSMEFLGFEESKMLDTTSDLKILEKLIAEAEVEDATPIKRGRLLPKIGGKKSDDVSDKLENDAKSRIDDSVDSDSVSKSKDEGANSSVSEKNSSSGQKNDMTNPMYKEPFKYGWRREMVYKGVNEGSQKRSADIYYYSPKGKKVKSLKEVGDCLTTKQLTLDNFTFYKEPIGLDDPALEVIRDAKRLRSDSTGAHPTPPKKNPPTKRGSTSKKSTSPTPGSKTPTSKWSPPKTTTPASFKVKITGKRGSQKKDIKMQKEQEMLPPQWSSPSVTRRSQATPDKTSSPKNKRLMKRKQALPKEVDQSQYFMPSVCAGYHTLSRIFQYLKVQELLRAARVCRMWRDLAAHQGLWKTVRMKNSQVTDWDGLAATLRRHGTQHLDLRKMLIVGESDNTWKKFVSVIPTITSLLKLEFCKCPVMVVEEVMKNCSQLEVLNAISIKCDTLNMESVGNLKNCLELKLKAVSGMSLQGDLAPLQELTQLTLLNLTSVKELGKKKIEVLSSLVNLQTLELGECSDFPDKFGTNVLTKLTKLERLRLEKGQGSCCTFDILDGISKLETLHQLELVNFDVKNGFDKCLASCKNIKRLLIIPTYISQSATSNNMVLGGITELSDNLTHFVWGVTLELLRVTELFVDQCNQMNKAVSGDSIPVLKPVPCLKLIENNEDENNTAKDEKISNSTNPQVDILPLPQLQKLLLTALPKTRVKILRIPFHATWRQSISDTTTQ